MPSVLVSARVQPSGVFYFTHSADTDSMAQRPIIRVTSNASKYKNLFSGFDRNVIRKATARSIKRTIVSGRAKSVSEMRSKRMLSMKAATMKTRITKHDHSGSGKPIGDQFGEIRFSGRQESLARFQAKRRIAGKSKLNGANLYVVSVNALGAPYLVSEKAFMVQKGAGKDKIILARAGTKRLPVTKQLGPSIADVAEKTGAMPILIQRVAIQYEKEMENNLKYYAARAISKAKGGA